MYQLGTTIIVVKLLLLKYTIYAINAMYFVQSIGAYHF